MTYPQVPQANSACFFKWQGTSSPLSIAKTTLVFISRHYPRLGFHPTSFICLEAHFRLFLFCRGCRSCFIPPEPPQANSSRAHGAVHTQRSRLRRERVDSEYDCEMVAKWVVRGNETCSFPWWAFRFPFNNRSMRLFKVLCYPMYRPGAKRRACYCRHLIAERSEALKGIRLPSGSLSKI
jgi:hypothetical protein